MDASTETRSSESRSYSRSVGRIGYLAKWICVVALLCLCSCCVEKKEPNPPGAAAPSADLRSVVERANDSIDDIHRDVDVILNEVPVVERGLDIAYETSAPEDKPDVDSAYRSLQDVQSRAVNIDEAAAYLSKDISKVDSLVNKVDNLERRLVELTSAVESARAKALEKLYGYITMFWVIGFGLIAGGIGIAIFLNKTYGASVSLLGILIIGFASASQYYLEEIAAVGAGLLIVGFVAGMGMIGWELFNRRRTSNALKEVIEIVEILKETMTDDEKTRIFGESGVVTRIQSDFTKALVDAIREKNGFKTLKEIKDQTNGDSSST